MPYLSWMEGSQPFRHAVVEDLCVLGRDPLGCGLSRPGQGTVSPVHAVLSKTEGAWWVKDLGSISGTTLNGHAVGSAPEGPLRDGDELALGSWRLTFTHGFPGLDGTTFAEHVGDLFDEIRLQSDRPAWYLAELKQLYGATERLLGEADSNTLGRALLEESLRLTSADRGLFVARLEPGGWRVIHAAGEATEELAPPASVLAYVARECTSILSNQPLADPRFEEASALEDSPGCFLCAPLMEEGQAFSALYLERQPGGIPFTRLDLATLQAFSRRGVLVLRQARLQRKAVEQAEQQGELLRLRKQIQQDSECRDELLAAMVGSVRRIQSWVREQQDPEGDTLRFHLERLAALVEEGRCQDDPRTPAATGQSLGLASLQEDLALRWRSLLDLRGIRWKADPPPQGAVWWLGGSLLLALDGLVEPLVMQLSPGAELTVRWGHEPGRYLLGIQFSAGLQGPSPDGWSQRVLKESGIRWRWADRLLEVLLPEGPEAMPDEPMRPLLGLVSEDLGLVGLFQAVAEAGDMGLLPLESEPPPPPLPIHRFLVIDAKGTPDAEATIRAYRRHPAFATTPILVVRCAEGDTPGLIEAGATDWLADGFGWEALHQRLRVLQGHTELRQRALAAERLESFRQMAGTLKHEINNPLAVISMQVEMLQRKYPEEAKLAKIGEMVDRIQGLLQVLQKMRETPTEGYADGSSILKLG
ncbi:FHA domain-containing protein [Geothrix alkalitolerans]|uniref:FHA domain-containing protein n=1 Tax=Geothrix alkalitolerans TaxID=2922724 RepID=UPI001FB03ADA|nr:FHA domain-containing protein [Geothrix alkalitolerans]